MATGSETDRATILPPCQVKCPIHEEIQRTNILISLLPDDPVTAAPKIAEIGDRLFSRNPLFPVCGYVCGICELACNYLKTGGAIRRRLLKRFIAEQYRERLAEIEPFSAGHFSRVAVIGGGPAGIMAAYELARRGYLPTIFESGSQLGGALRLIPHYRLPPGLLDETIAAIVRVARIEVRFNAHLGENGFDLDLLQREGFSALFIAVGSPLPRILTFAGQEVAGQQVPGVMYGHSFLYELAHGAIPTGYLNGRRTIVVGGGNVAIDAARSARRLGAAVTLVCLESDGSGDLPPLPADPHEVRGAVEEGVEIRYSRGVSRIRQAKGRFAGISAPRCTSVFDNSGFNPQFDLSDMVEIPAELLLIAVGQGPERRFLEREGLLDGNGRIAVDPLTLRSLNRSGLFVGGDMLRLGYMVDAMRDGVEAAESIDRFCRGADLEEGRAVEYSSPPPPVRHDYRHEPEIEWVPPEHRLDFNLVEKGFTLAEAIAEARRCLACGPCASCEACLSAGLREGIPRIECDEERCSGCGICLAACPYSAVSLKEASGHLVSATDPELCRGCGLCVAACPACARRLVKGSS